MWRMSNAQATDLAATFTLSKSCRLLFYDADLDGLRPATKPPALPLGNHPDPSIQNHCLAISRRMPAAAL